MTDARLEAPSVRAARAPRTKHGRYKIVGRASELAAPDEATDIPRGDVQMESGVRRGSGEQASSSSNTCARTEHAPGMVALTVRRLEAQEALHSSDQHLMTGLLARCSSR